jgi:hypothetical protein
MGIMCNCNKKEIENENDKEYQPFSSRNTKNFNSKKSIELSDTNTNTVLSNNFFSDSLPISSKILKSSKSIKLSMSDCLSIYNKPNDYRTTQELYYISRCLELINTIRNNPLSYINIIENAKKNIISIEEENRIIYKDIVKVSLNRGIFAFNEAIEELKNKKSLDNLIFDKNICIELPYKKKDIYRSKYLNDKVNEMKKKGKEINLYFKEFIRIPEVSVLMMIIDDNDKTNGLKRKILLSSKIKYIGISCKFIDNNFIAYFSFNKDLR